MRSRLSREVVPMTVLMKYRGVENRRHHIGIVILYTDSSSFIFYTTKNYGSSMACVVSLREII